MFGDEAARPQQLVHAVARSSRCELLADATLVANDNRASRVARGQGRRQAGDAGADHGNVRRMKVANLAGDRRPRLLHAPAASRVPHPGLDLLPSPLWSDQRLVVEADRNESMHAVDHRQGVVVD